LGDVAGRIITFSKYDHHSNPLYMQLKLLKLNDLIYVNNVLFMFKYHHQLLPKAFDNYFRSVSTIHQYNTRLASRSSYYAEPRIRTNFGRFSFKYNGPILWNTLNEKLKNLSLNQFKSNLKTNILNSYSD